MKRISNENLSILIFVLVTGIGILLPGTILHLSLSNELDEVKNAPEEYSMAINSAISKNVSKKLSDYERNKLISGAWSSQRTLCEASETGHTITEIANMAKYAVGKLYAAGLYDYSINSTYDNWYSWDVSCYRCTETTFHTYSTYCYLVRFYRYNNDEIHNVLINENGQLLYVSCNQPNQKHSGFWEKNIEKYCSEAMPSQSNPTLFWYTNNTADLPHYNLITDTEDSEIQAVNIVVTNNSSVASYATLPEVLPENTETYYIYYSTGKNTYSFTLIPVE